MLRGKARKAFVALALLAAPIATLVVHRARAGNGSATAIQILTGFSAKETCSCAFVVGQSDDYCNTFGQQPGYNVTITIDHGAKTVTSSFSTSTRVARFVDGAGCTLDPL